MKTKITKQEFIRLAAAAFGSKWQAKLGTPENHQRYGAWWCFLGGYNEDGSRSWLPLTRYTSWASGAQSAEELEERIREFNSRPAFGEGLTFPEFASLYLEEALRVAREEGADSPADWSPGLLRPQEKPWFERCQRAAQNAATVLGGGMGNVFQRRLALEAVYKELDVPLSQRDAIGATPTQEEWEKAFIILFRKFLI